MNSHRLRQDADLIVREAIKAVMPNAAVMRALEGRRFPGRVIPVAVGKAAWQMASAAKAALGPQLSEGLVITKYGHVEGKIEGIRCLEAGHPIPDRNSFLAAEEAIRLVKGLKPSDTVLFLLSGGGSALFEDELVPGEELREITAQLLAVGADIVEMNTIRKRLSGVKGGRFALKCAPARVFSIILSDILGDPPDMIASGPTAPDRSTCEEALEIARRYELRLSEKALELLRVETPKTLPLAEIKITGSVRELCLAAAGACRGLGYETLILTDRLCCEAKEAGSFLASILRTHAPEGKALAFIAGGETVVRVNGQGLGGRNQELALSAATGIAGLNRAAVFSVGSDGSDGPTDAAGGFADGSTRDRLLELGLQIPLILKDNNAYPALKAVNGLIMTGPTGTNVNDVAVGLLRA